jgi:hypothetical protein
MLKVAQAFTVVVMLGMAVSATVHAGQIDQNYQFHKFGTTTMHHHALTTGTYVSGNFINNSSNTVSNNVVIPVRNFAPSNSYRQHAMHGRHWVPSYQLLKTDPHKYDTGAWR